MLKKSIQAIVLSLGIGSIVACDVLDGPPNNEQAKAAVNAMMQQATLGVATPADFQLETVVVDQCVKQDAPAGHVCNVKLVSKEIPILGAIQIPLQLRFVKKEGNWTAYLN